MDVEGIIISSTMYRDQDAMITVLTNDTLLSVLAKGTLNIDSKNSSRIAKFTKSNLALMKTKEGLSLKNGKIISSYEKAKSSLDCLAVLDFISEITQKIIVQPDIKNLYQSLDCILEKINAGFDPWTLLMIYFANVISVAGIGLNVHSCQKCGQTHEITGVSYRSGGFICSKCFNASNHVKYSPRELKILRYIFMVQPKDYTKISFGKDELKRIFNDLVFFTENILQIELKSKSLLTKI